MRSLLLFATLALAACGADGPPEAPAQAGVTVSGEATIGIVTQ